MATNVRRRAPAGVQLLRATGVYASVAGLAILLFVFLHHIGNLTPFELAKQRLAEELLRAKPNNRVSLGASDAGAWQYCEISGAVLAGSRAEGDADALRDAILLKVVRPGHDWTGDYCWFFEDAVLKGVWPDVPEDAPWLGRLGTRHWWGTKAIYAIALRVATVRQFHSYLKIATYGAYVLLAVALLFLGWRALVVVAPVLLLGVRFSGIERLSTLTEGVPYLWALLVPAVGAALLACRCRGTTLRPCFFFGGMVSAYLWLFDGGNFLAAALIGLVGWLGSEQLPLRRRAVRALSFVGAYAAGFFACVAVGAGVRMLMAEWVLPRFVKRVNELLARIVSPETRDVRGRDLQTWLALDGGDPAFFEWFLLLSAAALAACVSIAVWRAWRGRRGLLVEVLWCLALLLLSCVHFLVPNDIAWRMARLMFLPLGLSWCCVMVVWVGCRPSVRQTAVTGGIVVVLATTLFVWKNSAKQRDYQSRIAAGVPLPVATEIATSEAVLAAVGDEEGVELHLVETLRSGSAETAQRELVYKRAPCAAADVRARFFVHVVPNKIANLPEHRRKFGFDSLDFHFYERGGRFLGTCYATVPLPAYARAVAIGQFDAGGMLWRQLVHLNGNTSGIEP